MPLASGTRFAIAVARWNETITRKLLDAAVATLKEQGIADDSIDVAWVPGSMEIPLVAQRFAASNRYAAVICLGAVIRGETPHFEHIAAEVTKGIASASMATGVPIAYGIITADTVEQAINRAGVKAGNKGFEAAMTAVEMANLLKEL